MGLTRRIDAPGCWATPAAERFKSNASLAGPGRSPVVVFFSLVLRCHLVDLSLEAIPSIDELGAQFVTLRLTNLADRRPDNVNLPTLRGVLTTEDGANAWVEMDGVATLRIEDGARVFVTSCRFRTGDERYAWLNTQFAILEGVLDSVGVGGVARGQLFECHATMS